MITQLKDVRNLINQDKLSDLKSNYNFSYDARSSDEEKKLLHDVFSKIDLNDINYYKNKGIYQITEDNGFVQIVYRVYIEDNEINISYNYMSHSEIIEDFDENTDYHSEDEFSYNWQFKFIDNKLNYVRLMMAG